MKNHKLRIAWSVTWAIVAVLLVGVWVRSYWWADSVAVTISANVSPLQIGSVQGTVGIVIACSPEVASRLTSRWNHFQSPTDEMRVELAKFGQSLPSPIYGGLRKIQSIVVFFVPDWLVLILVTVLGILPWLQWHRRFSLRTLLIATTLIAVVLGIVVWSMH